MGNFSDWHHRAIVNFFAIVDCKFDQRGQSAQVLETSSRYIRARRELIRERCLPIAGSSFSELSDK